MPLTKSILFLIILQFFISLQSSRACSCLQSSLSRGFCQVVVDGKHSSNLVVSRVEVLDFYHWGMRVAVLDDLYHTSNKDTIIVWGDNGATCRPFVQQEFNIGDTLVTTLILNVDVLGNVLTPNLPNYESPSDYYIGICGAYFMRYKQDSVHGSFYQNHQNVSMSYTSFLQNLNSCIAGTLSVTENQLENELLILPNPSSGHISISSKGHAVVKSDIINMSGQVVKSINPKYNSSVHIGDLSAGVYLVRVELSSGETVTKKIQKD